MIYLMAGIFAFVFGLILGSFANAVIWRLDKGKSVIWARSQCPKCGHKLSAFDLIPLVSFLALKGKCRYCSKKISWQYPAVELVSGLALAAIYLAPWTGAEKTFAAGVFLATLIICVYDLKHLIIPDVVVFLGSLWAVGWVLWLKSDAFWGNLLTAAALFLFFFLLHYFSRGRWVGGGDAKLGFLLGWWLGWPLGLAGLFLAYVIGAAVGVGLIISRKAGWKSPIPFGPFLITAAWIAYIWGGRIIEWYGNLLSI